MDGFSYIEWNSMAHTAVQIAILLGFFYFIYVRFIHRSHAEHLLKGLFVTLLIFMALWMVARLFMFALLEFFFSTCIYLLLLMVIVIFQPELRRILFFLGQPELFKRPAVEISKQTSVDQGVLIHCLCDAIRFLSKTRTGALIVLESANTSSTNYLEAGTALDAKLSTELLLTIFHPKTPLHDGAVVINSNHRIVAAGVLLPLTEDPKLTWEYGTRHRAAIGFSEVTDSICLVVSEETGTISLAQHGQLEKIASADALKVRLDYLYETSPSFTEVPKETSWWQRIRSWKSRKSPAARGLSSWFSKEPIPADGSPAALLKKTVPPSTGKK